MLSEADEKRYVVTCTIDSTMRCNPDTLYRGGTGNACCECSDLEMFLDVGEREGDGGGAVAAVDGPDLAAFDSVDEPPGLDPVLLDHVIAREVRREGGPAAKLLLAQL